jgi:hypothetical protein
MLLTPLLLLLALLAVTTSTIYKALTSPLNRIPGPWYARFTSLVLKWHEFRALRTAYIHHLHLRYGPAVRVSPNEVAFASAGAVREIYCSGGSGFDKTEFYDLFKVYGRRYVHMSEGLGIDPRWIGCADDQGRGGSELCLPRWIRTTTQGENASSLIATQIPTSSVPSPWAESPSGRQSFHRDAPSRWADILIFMCVLTQIPLFSSPRDSKGCLSGCGLTGFRYVRERFPA